MPYASSKLATASISKRMLVHKRSHLRLQNEQAFAVNVNLAFEYQHWVGLLHDSNADRQTDFGMGKR